MLFNNQYLLPSPKIFYPLVYQNPWNFSKSLIWFNIVLTEAPVRTLRRNSMLSSCHLWKQNMNEGLQYWDVVGGEGGALPGSGRHERLGQAMGEVWTSVESQWRMRALRSDSRKEAARWEMGREKPPPIHTPPPTPPAQQLAVILGTMSELMNRLMNNPFAFTCQRVCL